MDYIYWSIVIIILIKVLMDYLEYDYDWMKYYHDKEMIVIKYKDPFEMYEKLVELLDAMSRKRTGKGIKEDDL